MRFAVMRQDFVWFVAKASLCLLAHPPWYRA